QGPQISISGEPVGPVPRLPSPRPGDVRSLEAPNQQQGRIAGFQVRAPGLDAEYPAHPGRRATVSGFLAKSTSQRRPGGTKLIGAWVLTEEGSWRRWLQPRRVIT